MSNDNNSNNTNNANDNNINDNDGGSYFASSHDGNFNTLKYYLLNIYYLS